MSAENLLRLAFLTNICILLPVCRSLFWGRHSHGIAVLEGKSPESACLRILVASLWSGVLACSVLALICPTFFLPLLVFQVIYKSIFLATYSLPRALSGRRREIPWGVSLSFLAIVLTYPVVVWMALR